MEQTLPRLHLYHIPRTGGMSIGKFFRQYNVTSKHPKRIGYHISGHAHYKPFPEPYFTLLGIRDPIDHTASLYKYIKSHKSHKESAKVSKMTFAQYIKYSRDSYLGFLTSKKNRSVEQAIHNLSEISFIYLTHNLNDNMRIFLKYLNAKLEWHNTRFNITQPMKKGISKKDAQAIRIKRAADFEIYEAAKELNTKQIAHFKSNTRNGLIPNLNWNI